ncbi:FecR family protein [Pedobacter jamesrossensis]|uniref:FecR family protein n=1 Tax=Pedobacter jamesrossensis TaxID=1908238 RepID=A0ABV8NT36_9SPHI
MENDAKKLLEKYLNGNSTAEESAVVEDWYLQIQFEKDAPNHAVIEESKKQIWSKLHRNRKSNVLPMLKMVGIAASIVLSVAVGFYFIKYNSSSSLQANTTPLKSILPGGKKAILTLSDGTVVDLDNAKDGQIANQNGIVVLKSKNGGIEYLIKDEHRISSGINTIYTPRGGQYQVSLPDGTKVWLNAASSLKYPYSFAKTERLVELKGEAYFEVSKDKTRPFKVRTTGQTVEVLGTHFNINAYQDEDLVKTTLLEGAVKVISPTSKLQLRPGEQSLLSTGGDKLTVNTQVDTDKEIAWKNDVFSFDDDDLKTVMRQISRWYDIDVVYKGKIDNEKYVGEIPRSSNLSEVFKILELNHIHAEVKGKVLTISGK